MPIRRRLASAAIVLGLAATGVLVAPLTAQAAASVSIPNAVAQILADTNALRVAGGLAPLVESTAIDTVAQNWSAQMSANGALTHNPNYSTQIPAGWTGAAENIASGYTTTTVVEAWHQSAGHYANIMGSYNAIGIGYYEANGQTYFTQDFGSYATVPSPAPSPTSTSSATPTPTPTASSAVVGATTTAPVSVYRFWSPQSSTHFYTASATERDDIIASYPTSVWTYEGVAYSAFLTQQAGTVPLYRFWSPQFSGHFYTASATEKNAIIADYPSSTWNFEGIAYYVYPSNSTAAGTLAVSRFWSPTSRHHFYTASVAEKNSVIANYPASIWSYEGDTFRVPPAPATLATSAVPPTVTLPAPVAAPVAPPAGITAQASIGKGWALTSSSVGLAPFGLTCSALPEYQLSGNTVPAGTTIYRQRITGWLDLSMGNITISQSCIQPKPGYVGAGSTALTTWSTRDLQGPVVIQDSEYDGSLLDQHDQAWINLFSGAASMYRNYIHNSGSGISIQGSYEKTGQNIIIQNNYVDHLVAYGDANGSGNHQSAFTVRDTDLTTNPNRQLLVKDNYLNATGGSVTGSFFIQPNGDNVSNVTAQGNYLGGEGFNLILQDDRSRFPGVSYHNMRATDNRFHPTEYGPTSVTGTGEGWTTFTNNYLYSATATDGKGAAVTTP